MFERCNTFVSKSKLLANILAALYAETLVDQKTFFSVCFHPELQRCSIVVGDRTVLSALDQTLFEEQKDSVCFFVEEFPWGYLSASVPFAFTITEERRLTQPKMQKAVKDTAVQLMAQPANRGLYIDLSTKPEAKFLARPELERLMIPHHLYSTAEKAAQEAVKDVVAGLNDLTVDN